MKERVLLKMTGVCIEELHRHVRFSTEEAETFCTFFNNEDLGPML
jgi:hypothetical protein